MQLFQKDPAYNVWTPLVIAIPGIPCGLFFLYATWVMATTPTLYAPLSHLLIMASSGLAMFLAGIAALWMALTRFRHSDEAMFTKAGFIRAAVIGLLIIVTALLTADRILGIISLPV